MNSLKLETEQLELLVQLGSALFTPSQCAIMLEIPEAEFTKALNDPKDIAFSSYEKGKLQALFLVRQNIVEMAKNGSSPAQTAVLKLYDNLLYEQTKSQT